MALHQTSSLTVFFIFLCFVFASFSVYGSTYRSADRASLLAFKSKISNDPLGIFNSWNESTDFCNWSGVTCGRLHRSRVTKLDLQYQQLEGTLSPHIGNLSFLRTLNLLNNSFTLEIPQELGSLFRLQILHLVNNSFSGEIPANLSRCSNLNIIRLDGNDLGGEIPSKLGILSKLQVLSLSQNKFVGRIPPSLGNLSSLWSISGAYNNLHGSLPSTFGQLKNLQQLSFAENKLSGPIPTSFFNLSSLTILWLGDNELNGSLPNDIGHTLPKLESLYLSRNQFSGPIPITIANITFLRIFQMRANGFTGKVPYLGSLHDLRKLDLSYNYLGNEENDDLNFMSSLLNCTGLESLELIDNSFGGMMPEFLSNFSKQLTTLGLASNKIYGRIPSEIGNLISLGVIRMETNLLTGSVPSSIGKLENLYALLLQENKLSGQIPPSIGNLSWLGVLHLDQNNLQGHIPPSLGRCIYILIINLSKNNLSGTIPREVLSIPYIGISLDLSENILTGPLLLEVGNLALVRSFDVSGNYLGNGEKDDLKFMSVLLNCTGLVILGLENNNFGGILPEFLSNFTRQITRLTLGRNHIQGGIPSEIGNLVNLVTLGMQTNLLTGIIPSSLGKLQNLNNLYLDGNKFSGQIPSSIGNLSLLGMLHLGRNKLQGSIPPSIGGCINLLGISLSRNNLSGTIPKEMFSISSLSSYLDLSENILTGPLPLEVGKLVHLGSLNVSENNLFGEIPQTLGSCASLEGLYLEGNFFHGEIPSSLDTLRGLQKLDLSRNNLSGQVPSYLENITLLYLNLSWNDFGGQLPQHGVFSNLNAISVAGNKKLCGGIPDLHLPSCTLKKSKPSEKLKLKLVVSLVSVVVGMILVSVLIVIYMSRKKRKLSTNSSFSIETSIPKVSYDDLHKATNGFSSSNLIGSGGFGFVYKGLLGLERSVVAIKVLNLAKKGATKSFMAECKALRSIRHRNLVKIITACSSVDFKGNYFKALVYEFMINGSLEDWLHPVHINESDERKYLSFIQRFNIVVGVANALDYMHNECHIPIVHCDLKPSNILLDQDMLAHVGDFGLARLCPEASHQFSSAQSSSLGIKGSIGYAAPEYGIGSEVSTYGDVYSFGILLLETFTGKRPTDSMFKDGLDLHNFAKMALPERVMHVVDPILYQNDDQFRSDKVLDCLISVVKLGVACSVESRRERLDIKKVAEELVHIRNNLLQAGVHLTDVEGSPVIERTDAIPTAESRLIR